MDTAELIDTYPRLYHMAHAGAWPGIQKHGLLSTSALLDLFEINGAQRARIEAARRPDSVTIEHPVHGTAVIRDNIPLSEAKLRACLVDMTPQAWYRHLNARVFFWLTPHRVQTLLGARAYRHQRHTVITLDTAGLLARHRDAVTLSAINSGSTAYNARPRGRQTFRRIDEYPFAERRRLRGASEAIAELAVDHAVPNMLDFTVRAELRGADGSAEALWERP